MKICIVNRWNPGMRPSLLKLMLEKRIVILYHWGLDDWETRYIPMVRSCMATNADTALLQRDNRGFCVSMCYKIKI